MLILPEKRLQSELIAPREKTAPASILLYLLAWLLLELGCLIRNGLVIGTELLLVSRIPALVMSSELILRIGESLSVPLWTFFLKIYRPSWMIW